MLRVLFAAALALGIASPAGAQNFAPQPQVPLNPQLMRPNMTTPVATICSTDWGWCPLQSVLTPGGYCVCFVPPSTRLPGSARYFPYQGPVSPYLNPHTGPPATLR